MNTIQKYTTEAHKQTHPPSRPPVYQHTSQTNHSTHYGQRKNYTAEPSQHIQYQESHSRGMLLK